MEVLALQERTLDMEVEDSIQVDQTVQVEELVEVIFPTDFNEDMDGMV